MKTWHPCHIKKAINITSLYTAFIRQYDKELNFVGETHNFWEISCVLDGTVCIASDSDTYTVTAGHAIIFKPMTFHRLWACEDNPPRLATVSFDADLNIDVNDCIFELSLQDCQQICHIINNIQTEFKCDGVLIRNQQSPFAQITVSSLENFILSFLPNPSPKEVTRSNTSAAFKYTEIIRCLTDNIGDNLTVDDIARICKMSPSSVKQIFKHYTGIGIMQFYRQMKMNSAISMLLKGVSIRDISQNLGYTDSSYFSTVFKRVVGVSPTKYVSKTNNQEKAQ